MPHITLKLAGTLSKDQKAQIVKEFSETMERVAGKPKNVTLITIEEFPRENWGRGGELLA